MYCMFEVLHNWEMGLLEALQHFRTPSRDYFFTLLDFYDSDRFYFLLLPVVWAFCGRRWGWRLMYLILLSAIINIDAKNFFAQPRPSHVNPALGLVQTSSYGFPSGAAQSHMILAGFGILAMPRLMPTLFFIFTLSLISFSRLYLGVHFLTDVIGGWVIGLVLVLGYALYHERLEKWAAALSAKKALFFSFIIPCMLLLIHPILKNIIYTSMMLGINIGLWLSCYASGSCMKPLFSISRKLLYIAIAIPSMFLLTKGAAILSKQLAHSSATSLIFATTYAILGIWLSWGIERLLSCIPQK